MLRADVEGEATTVNSKMPRSGQKKYRVSSPDCGLGRESRRALVLVDDGRMKVLLGFSAGVNVFFCSASGFSVGADGAVARVRGIYRVKEGCWLSGLIRKGNRETRRQRVDHVRAR